MRAPGEGASCLCVGRPGSGALPAPTSRPLGRAARARYPLAVGAVCGRGGRAVLVTFSRAAVRHLLCAVPRFAAPGGRCGLAPPNEQIEHKSGRSSVRLLLAGSLPALVQCRCGGVVEMLRKSSSPLFGCFDTAVACCSDLCVMPTSQSQVRRTQFCSLHLSHGQVVVVDPSPG